MDIVQAVRDAGVVGAGGAGFPTHVKAAAKAETVIVNGAECEPLLHKDKEILKAFPEEVLSGLEAVVRATGAREGVLALKAKHKALVEKYSGLLKSRKPLRLATLDDYYPAGDEFCLVYEVTKRLIPPGGLPLQVGTVVSNVETFYNVARAAAGEPVTDTFLTVAGAVQGPCTLRLPVGTPMSHAIAEAGGAVVKDFAVIDGGPMMGRVLFDASEPLTKTSGGFIVLPPGHPLVRRKSAPRRVFSRIGQSACDQCSYCTEFCPRYLLGYPIQPHRVMRSLGFSGDRKPLNEWALMCCECSLCSLYACPEQLDPRNVCVAAKGDLRASKVDWKASSLNTGQAPRAHSMREFRKVPVARLVRRLGLWDYLSDAPLTETKVPVRRVRIPLKQHVGAPCVPSVSVGQKVTRGQVIGEVPDKQLGARVHASIDGVVRAVDAAVTIEA